MKKIIPLLGCNSSDNDNFQKIHNFQQNCVSIFFAHKFNLVRRVTFQFDSILAKVLVFFIFENKANGNGINFEATIFYFR